MKFKQISILSVLLAMTIIGLVISLVFEKQKSQQAIEMVTQLKDEAGYIDVEDPSLVHLRALHSEGTSHWEFRIYLPPDHEMNFEIAMGDPSDPEIHFVDGSPPSGQFNLTVHEAVDVLKPNQIRQQCFVIGVIGKHSYPHLIGRYGEGWRESLSAKYRKQLGRYDNISHRTSLQHGEVKTYRVDEEVTLLKILDQSQGTSDIPENPRDAISIKLKRKTP